jgi:hypothetical protein
MIEVTLALLTAGVEGRDIYYYRKVFKLARATDPFREPCTESLSDLGLSLDLQAIVHGVLHFLFAAQDACAERRS